MKIIVCGHKLNLWGKIIDSNDIFTEKSKYTEKFIKWNYLITLVCLYYAIYFS